MSENIDKPKVEAPPEPPADKTVTPPDANATEEKKFTQAELDLIIKERLEREKRRAEEIAAKAKEKAEAEALAKNQEWEKLAKQREEELVRLNAELEAAKLAELRSSIARKVNLPDALVSRLVGKTAEEIEADAKKLLEAIKQPPPPQLQSPNNPINARTGETIAERRRRLGIG